MDKIFKSNDNKLQIRSMRSILPVKLAVFLKITHNIGGDAQKWAFFFFTLLLVWVYISMDALFWGEMCSYFVICIKISHAYSTNFSYRTFKSSHRRFSFRMFITESSEQCNIINCLSLQ